MKTPNRKPAAAGLARQRGVTLFVALVLLVMVTLLAVSSFRVSNTNLKVVGSMQGRNEAISAAQAAIETVISSSTFTSNPAAVGATAMNVDIDGDTIAEYTVNMTPQPACLRQRETPTTSLDPLSATDRGCYGSAKYGGSTSNCADTIWEVSATTKDPVTSAETTVRQGISIRLEKGEALNTCK